MSLISHLAATLGGVLGWISIVILPGAWVAFGLRLSRFPFWIRFLTGMVLSPLVVGLQFYAIRLLGPSFEVTTYLLVLVNLPAVWLIYRHRSDAVIPDKITLLGAAAVLTFTVACLAPQVLDAPARMFSGHAWMHADIVYMLSNGDLWLHDPELAGVRLGYPWAGHVYQAVLSFLIDSPSTSAYIWTNVVWLVCFFGFVYYIVGEFTKDRFSRITSFIWLCFGLNFVGYILRTVALTRPEIVQRFWIGGDSRYTPWLRKFLFFEQIIFGLGMFAAILYFCTTRWNQRLKTGDLIIIGALLCGIGLIYPILIAPAAVVVLARAALLILERDEYGLAYKRWDGILLCVVLLAAGLMTAGYLHFLTVDRVTASINLPSLSPDYVKYTLRKLQGTIIAVSLLAAFLALVIRTYWRVNPTAMFVLTVGAGGSVLLNLIFEIPNWGNEYKFLLTAALCLAPFPALALEPIMHRLKGWALPVFALITVILAAPFAHKLSRDFPWRKSYGHSPGVFIWRPNVDSGHFELTLDRQEPLFELCDAIRTKTSNDALLVIERTELHFPSVTQRRLYAPPAQDDERQGVNIDGFVLLANIRGYGKELIETRRRVLNELFLSVDADRRSNALDRILQHRAPVAIVLEIPRHDTLREWLRAKGMGRSVFTDGRLELWSIDPKTDSSGG